MGNVEPAIYIGGEVGAHNADYEATRKRLSRSRTYKDLSTVCIIPTRGMIPARVVESWWGMMTPMNQKFTRVIVRGMEVGDAYNQAIALILDNPELSTWKYILTLEEDNMPSPDSLLKLYENIEEFDAVGGLYWTKGMDGQPMIYGNPKEMLNFIPQAPFAEGIQECNGLGMGFTLFKTDLFREVEAPWFVTQQSYDMAGVKQYTQDLYFFERIRKMGKRVACDTRVKVGHYDVNEDIVW